RMVACLGTHQVGEGGDRLQEAAAAAVLPFGPKRRAAGRPGPERGRGEHAAQELDPPPFTALRTSRVSGRGDSARPVRATNGPSGLSVPARVAASGASGPLRSDRTGAIPQSSRPTGRVRATREGGDARDGQRVIPLPFRRTTAEDPSCPRPLRR